MLNLKPTSAGLISLAALLAAMLSWSDAWAGAIAGHVVFSRGACAALVEGAENAPRLLGSNAEVYEGDMIQTGNDSFVVVEFADKARITIRPNSSFRVQKYSTEGKQEAKLFLEKGGISADMGQIAKSNPDKFQVDTPLASIKSQGADFSARLSDDKDAPANTKPDNSVARAVQVQGKVEVVGENSALRDLVVGQALFEKEKIRSQTGAYAVLVFRDGSKATVQPESELEITAFHYQPGDNANNKQLLKLIAGGVRAFTGAIGKEKKENVQLVTPVATIGIRGSGWTTHILEKPVNGSEAGNYTDQEEGGTTHTNDAGSFPLDAGQTNHIRDTHSQPRILPGPPPWMQVLEQMTPSPGKVTVDMPLLFNAAPKAGPTLDVKAKGDGKVTVEDKKGGKTELGDKQSSKTNSSGGGTTTSASDNNDDSDDDGDSYQSFPGSGSSSSGGSSSTEDCK